MACRAVDCLRELSVASAIVVAASLAGCSSKSPCSDPKGSMCAATNAYDPSDPHSVCHVCCESNASYSDAWTELQQTDTASGVFTAVVSQTRPLGGQVFFTAVKATRSGDFFIFNDTMSNPSFGYHLLTRGRSDEGNVQVYVFFPGDGPVSAAPLNCTLARN